MCDVYFRSLPPWSTQDVVRTSFNNELAGRLWSVQPPHFWRFPTSRYFYCGLQSEYNINKKGHQAQRLLEKILALEQSTTHSLVQVYHLTSSYRPDTCHPRFPPGPRHIQPPTITKRRVLRVKRHPRRLSLDLISILGISPLAGLDRVDRIVTETVELL
jgi:hypothetical protein